MPDWNVQVITEEGQIKNIKVYDYNYLGDAESAALSQTGGKRVIWASPFVESPKTDNVNTEGTKTYSQKSYTVYDYSLRKDKISGFVSATLLPTIVLWLFHPFLAILFNILLARWWFTN